mmetsp:Transcript_72076/g.203474  ORF Transcript_72076/g.203474 Transcript_72076/m.203474 type:complete len:1016 (-) Transcript_72076:94-3141(-)
MGPSSGRAFLEVAPAAGHSLGSSQKPLPEGALGAGGGVGAPGPAEHGAPSAVACASLAAAVGAVGVSSQRSRKARRRSNALGAPCVFSSSCGMVATSSFAFSGSSCMQGSVLAPSRAAGVRPAVARKAMMFERFTEKTIKAVMMAQEESRRLGHNYVGTEMMLVGVVSETSGAATKVLRKLGVTLKDVKKAVEDMVGKGSGMVAVEIPFTPACKRVLSNAVEESRKLNSNAIDTAHILLALMKEEGGKATELLQILKVDPSKIPEELSKEISEKEEKALVGVSSKGGASGKTATLEEYGTDLTKAALEGTMDPLIGRAAELERTIQILARRQKNNPVLIGEPGVGKTAIAEGLAMMIASGDVPELLQGKRIVQLDLAMLLAGTRYRGEFEERLKNVINEVLASKKQIILMIDEIHTLVGAGGDGGGGAMDAANILKPALSRGDLQIIGATTITEYRKYIEKDKALERRFQPVNVPEPTPEETVQILKGLACKYEKHHRLRYTEEALEACVKFASQYITDRFLPDKAIDVMDETGARVQLQQLKKIPDSAKEVRALLRDVEEKKNQAVKLQDFLLAKELKAQEDELTVKVHALIKQGADNTNAAAAITSAVAAADGGEAQVQADIAAMSVEDVEQALTRPIVTENDVAKVVSAWTGVPVEKVNADESVRLLALDDTLHKRVIGQEEAVAAIAKAVRRARAGLQSPSRPIASFIFCGPTGVGKTELCKALAAAYFGKEEAMIRLDMSEYMERHTVSKLIGSPPGYVGYDEESQLTDGIRRKPYSVVLFDEVEKAHPDVFNLMLQILEDGRLTDSKGRVVSFKNALIIMTSNVGSKVVEKSLSGGGGLGFGGMDSENDAEASSYKRLKEQVGEELKNFFRPEFLNRLDELIVFKSLTKPEVGEIAELEIRKTFKLCAEKGLKLSITDRFKKKVVDEGFNPVYGARPLRRAITRLLEDQLAESFLKTPVINGEYAIVDLDSEGEVVVFRQQIENSPSDGSEEEGATASVEQPVPEPASA